MTNSQSFASILVCLAAGAGAIACSSSGGESVGTSDAPLTAHVEKRHLHGERVLASVTSAGVDTMHFSVTMEGQKTRTRSELFGPEGTRTLWTIHDPATHVTELRLTTPGREDLTWAGGEQERPTGELAREAAAFQGSTEVWLAALKDPKNGTFFNGDRPDGTKPRTPAAALAQTTQGGLVQYDACSWLCSASWVLVCSPFSGGAAIGCGMVSIPYCDFVCSQPPPDGCTPSFYGDCSGNP